MPARACVCVVANHGRIRQRPVDATVDPREAGGDLVDRAMEVVDPALQRDSEVDEVRAAAAEQDPLRVSQPADAHPEPEAQEERNHGRSRRGDREDQLSRHRSTPRARR